MDAKEYFERHTDEIYDAVDMHNRPSINLVRMVWDAAQEEICKELNVTDNYNRLRYPNGRN
jgi:hypothetical protein